MSYTIIILVLLFGLALTVLLYASKAHNMLKAVGLALFLSTGMVSTGYYFQQLGSPVVGIPEYEFIYIHHIVETDGSILLWASHPETGKDRLYVFDYTREDAKKLQEAKEASEGGQAQVGSFEPKERGSDRRSLGFRDYTDDTKETK